MNDAVGSRARRRVFAQKAVSATHCLPHDDDASSLILHHSHRGLQRTQHATLITAETKATRARKSIVQEARSHWRRRHSSSIHRIGRRFAQRELPLENDEAGRLASEHPRVLFVVSQYR
jgi:hypothetical protein